MEGVVIMKYQIYYCNANAKDKKMKYQIYYCNANTKDKTKKIKRLYTKTCSNCHKEFNTTDSFRTCKRCRNCVAKYWQEHKSYHIYTVALKSDLDKVLYVGSTTYLRNRISAHKNGNAPGTRSIFKDNPLSDIVIKTFDVSNFINNTNDLLNLEYFCMWYYHRPLNNKQYEDDFCYNYSIQDIDNNQVNQVNQFLKMLSNKEFNIWNWR